MCNFAMVQWCAQGVPNRERRLNQCSMKSTRPQLGQGQQTSYSAVPFWGSNWLVASHTPTQMPYLLPMISMTMIRYAKSGPGIKVRAPTSAQPTSGCEPKSGLRNPSVGAAGHSSSVRLLLEQSRTHLCSSSSNSRVMEFVQLFLCRRE